LRLYWWFFLVVIGGVAQIGPRRNNKGLREFGKLGQNSGYGGFGLNLDKYPSASNKTSSKQHLTTACFITAYARQSLVNSVDLVVKNDHTFNHGWVLLDSIFVRNRI
jgi:hypothetical protein